MPTSSSLVEVINRHQHLIMMGFIVIIILGLEFLTSTVNSPLNNDWWQFNVVYPSPVVNMTISNDLASIIPCQSSFSQKMLEKLVILKGKMDKMTKKL